MEQLNKAYIPSDLYIKLNSYSSYTDNQKEILVNNIINTFIKNQGFNVEVFEARGQQKLIGDSFIYIPNFSDSHLVEYKASHTYNNTDKLAIDLLYLKKRTKEPYNSNGSNKGWIYTLKYTELLMVLNPTSKKVYSINFKPFKELIQRLHLEYKCKLISEEQLKKLGIEVIVNRRDKLKDTVGFSIDLNKLEL